jgi:formate transporter
MFLTKQYTFGADSDRDRSVTDRRGEGRVYIPAGHRPGILCNALVCLAVWLTFSARSTVDKIVAIIFPITAFVAAGFEHSIANMYFIPYALLHQVF